ncbi:SMP-30/gluconolactonase/LRE family protein [Crenobacter intestini]|uniref:SMP-30/gluconolactonase/LRE family protein n=1 Tax=Crenobacter intestini TaxID=2563443 RepID=A0A4T0UW84_9NEIS|nr:SMP-30/gluconolactonase/LRE family protein [Crenobacter intestini]TIC83117.1 SMP-30/gluconolactonase/LRE family protein [Crenobacter intestini]
MRNLRTVLENAAKLGECPRWSVREQALYWVDITGQTLFRLDAKGALRRYPLPQQIGCFALRQNGGFVVALRDGVYLTDADGVLEKMLAPNPTDPACSRFNDGRADAHGNFWAGTLWEPRDAANGKLVRVRPDGHSDVVAGEVTVSNGLAFSPDGQWLMHADTRGPAIWRYPLDAHGEICGARSLVRRFAAGEGRPDGAAFDSAGTYWVALFDGACVLGLDAATGRTVGRLDVPARWPTMVAFGGADLKTLYITTSREKRSAAELAAWPRSGDLFAADMDVAGLPEPCAAL